MEKHRSYCFTVRPGATGQPGLSQETEQRLMVWMKKQPYAVAVIEGEDESRHLHGQVWLEDPGCVRGQINTSLKRICEATIENWTKNNAKVLCQGTRIAYSDWFMSYLDPETRDKCKILDYKYHVINNPPDKTEEYYPSEE